MTNSESELRAALCEAVAAWYEKQGEADGRSAATEVIWSLLSLAAYVARDQANLKPAGFMLASAQAAQAEWPKEQWPRW